MHLSIDIICDFGLFTGSNYIRINGRNCIMVILKIKTFVFLCDGANMNAPDELPASIW